MECEIYTLAPSVVADKARRLASTGLYEQALALLLRNVVEARVYPTRVEMTLPRPQGRSPGRGEKKRS